MTSFLLKDGKQKYLGIDSLLILGVCHIELIVLQSMRPSGPLPAEYVRN